MKKSEKRILVDMCLTTVHHGHIRILQKGSLLGQVIVGLATDEEIFKAKGFEEMIQAFIPGQWNFSLSPMSTYN